MENVEQTNIKKGTITRLKEYNFLKMPSLVRLCSPLYN